MTFLSVLLIEDNEETLNELQATLPTTIGDYSIKWETYSDFDDALDKMKSNRYDLIVTDIYVDAHGHKESYSLDQTGAGRSVELIRQTRFCPILAITDGSKPDRFPESPFIAFADKSRPEEIVKELTQLLDTGIPQIARKLHDEIDLDTSNYLWNFLEQNWASIEKSNAAVLERLIRRRIAILISRLDSGTEYPSEIEDVEGLEFYIYPPISNDNYRLGEVLYNSDSNTFIVLLTPHCHLTVQPNATSPRADFVLTVEAIDAKAIISEKHRIKTSGKTQEQINESIRRRIQGPARVGIPAGRYWFMPNFLDIPDLYCDFLRINSIKFDELKENYERIAVLDTPFAESLQSAFTAFYSAVGTPNLNPTRFRHLLEHEDSR